MGTLRRLRGLATAIAPQPAPAAMEEAEIATDEPVDVADLPPTLLSDSQVVSFINRGYVILPLTEFSASFHAGVHEESERLYHMAGDKGGAALKQHLSGDLGPQRGDARADRARRRHLGLRPELLHLAAPLHARVDGPGRPGL